MNNITSTPLFPITSSNNQNLKINTEQIKISVIDAQPELLTRMTQDKSSTGLSKRLDPLLERLRPDLQKTLIDSDLNLNISLSGDDYIGYLNSLDDEKLSQVVNVMQTLSMNPKIFDNSSMNELNRDLQSRSKGFLDSIKGLDNDSQSRVLDKMLEYGKDIMVTPLENNDTYVSILNNGGKGSSVEANDLHNFLYLISQSNDVNKTIDNIEQFTEAQQSDVMFILTSMPEKESDRVLNLLDNKNEETQNKLLNYFSNIAKRSSPLLPFDLKLKSKPILESNTYTSPVVDSQYIEETKSLLNNSLSLFENFSLEDNDLNEMLSDISGLGFVDQRAFIQLSVTGLELLEGKKGNIDSPVAVSSVNNDLLRTLRQNSSVLSLVNATAFGQQNESSGFFLIKDDNSAKTDQQELIKVITLYAKLNANSDDLSQRSQQFVDNLLSQEPDSRDVLVDELLNFIPSDLSITDLSDEALTSSLKDFKSASNSISYSQDINALLNLAPKSLPEITREIAKSTKDKEQITNFWQAMEFSEKKVDLLVDVLKRQSQTLRADIINGINQTIENIDVGKISKQDGIKWFDEFLEKLSTNLAEEYN